MVAPGLSEYSLSTESSVFWYYICPGESYKITEVDCVDMVYEISYYTGGDPASDPWVTGYCGQEAFAFKPPSACSYLRFDYLCQNSSTCVGQHEFTAVEYPAVNVTWLDVTAGLPLSFVISQLDPIFTPICRLIPTSTYEHSMGCAHDLADDLYIYDEFYCLNGVHYYDSVSTVASVNYTIVVYDFEDFNSVDSNYNPVPIILGASESVTSNITVTRSVNITIHSVEPGGFVTGNWSSDFGYPYDGASLRLSGSTLQGKLAVMDTIVVSSRGHKSLYIMRVYKILLNNFIVVIFQAVAFQEHCGLLMYLRDKQAGLLTRPRRLCMTVTPHCMIVIFTGISLGSMIMGII